MYMTDVHDVIVMHCGRAPAQAERVEAIASHLRERKPSDGTEGRRAERWAGWGADGAAAAHVEDVEPRPQDVVVRREPEVWVALPHAPPPGLARVPEEPVVADDGARVVRRAGPRAAVLREGLLEAPDGVVRERAVGGA